MDIKPERYDLWLEWLIKTVEEFDSQFTKDIESVWRNVMRPGIEFIKSRYEPQRDAHGAADDSAAVIPSTA